MSRFLRDAGEILEAANAAQHAGHFTHGLTVLVGGRGPIELLASNDWPLDRLRAERGAEAAYRVTRENGRVRVEGHTRDGSCVLKGESGHQARLHLVPDRRAYQVIEMASARPPAGPPVRELPPAA
ncbi:MAG: hypothetical protein FJW40_15165 [Acidobacteria bacterium]|nr:hypothetical protein [Acidobacteriota bacterium]